MDVVWLILDSLSFSSTPFSEGGPATMPQLESLVDERGIVYTRAYAPGPTSPSSHSSFFTGELPSVTGMHEGNPYFSADLPTVDTALEMDSFGVSTNTFIFNGLCDNFDEVNELSGRDFLLFDDASNPARSDFRRGHSNAIEKYANFLFANGKPVRSLLNGISYRLSQRRNADDFAHNNPLDSERYQYANTTNERIREFIANARDDAFVVANYMDVHAPLDASDEAIQRFSDLSHDELPVGTSGQEIHDRVQNGDEEAGEVMNDLYEAAIWDLDRKVTPLIRELVEAGSFVVVTSDHGNWFRRERELEEERLHVPLILLAPGESPRTIDETVNLRSLPRTTMNVVRGTDGGFEGVDLTNVSENQLSITELIHDPDVPGSPVDPYASEDRSIRYDIAAIKGDSRVDFVDGEFVTVRSGPAEDELREAIADLRARDVTFDPENATIDSDTEQRLEQLGYLT